MKRLRHKYIKEIFFLIFVIIFSKNIYADSSDFGERNIGQVTNSCEILSQSIKEIYPNRSSKYSPFLMEANTTHLKFKIDTSQNNIMNIGPFAHRVHNIYRTKSNNIILDYLPMKLLKKYKVKTNTEIIAINGIPVADLSDKEIREATTDRKIVTLDFLSKMPPFELRSETIKPAIFWTAQLGINVTETLFSDIDAKKSQHIANLKVHLSMTIYDFFGNDAKKLLKSLRVKSQNQLNRLQNKSWVCQLSNEDFQELNLYYPSITISNQINSEASSNSNETFYFQFMMSKNSNTKDYLIISKVIDYTGAVFKGPYNFKAFPFDSQYLRYDVLINSNGWDIYPYITTNKELLTRNDNFLSEWVKPAYFSYQNFTKVEHGFLNPGITFITNVERNYSYYLLKIFLPILIILLVSWAVFWIKPKEVESRLTVSVVCLLSLIAYTFIIDEVIPKLSYLTIMDYSILVSYFFSTIPTLQTIYISQLLPNNEDRAIRINNSFKRYTPITYFLIFLIIFFSVINNSSNVVEALNLNNMIKSL